MPDRDVDQCNGFVGLVIVTHSAPLAEGLADLVGQVSGPDVPIEAIAAEAPTETLGTDGGRVLEALRTVAREARLRRA